MCAASWTRSYSEWPPQACQSRGKIAAGCGMQREMCHPKPGRVASANGSEGPALDLLVGGLVSGAERPSNCDRIRNRVVILRRSVENRRRIPPQHRFFSSCSATLQRGRRPATSNRTNAEIVPPFRTKAGGRGDFRAPQNRVAIVIKPQFNR